MYFFDKPCFLDKSIWNDELTYDQIAMILRKVLGVKHITQSSAERYAKLFNSRVLNYLKSICPDTDFHKGNFVKNIMKRTKRGQPQ